jgi:hypothetical protein
MQPTGLALAEQLKFKRENIISELMRRALEELKGTLYEQMNEQLVLQARYENVLEVITEYAEKPQEALFLQHHLIIFLQRYYVNIDEQNPLTKVIVQEREQQITRSVNLYLEVLKQFTTPDQHAYLDEIFVSVRRFIHQMGEYLSNHVEGELSVRWPRVRLLDTDYELDSVFDIDPLAW